MCDAIDGVSQHIETSASGSDCVYLRNGPDACKNCLDLNCTIPITASIATITVKSEVSVLPCHDGNLNVPRHAINTRILDSSGQVLFSRQSDQSYSDSFTVRVSTIFGTLSVPVDVSVTIDNQGNGVSTQVSKSGKNASLIPLGFAVQTDNCMYILVKRMKRHAELCVIKLSQRNCCKNYSVVKYCTC